MNLPKNPEIKPVWNPLGVLLFTRRKQLGFTLAIVAHHAHCNSAYLSRVENGFVVPSEKFLARISATLSIPHCRLKDIRALVLDPERWNLFGEFLMSNASAEQLKSAIQKLRDAEQTYPELRDLV